MATGCGCAACREMDKLGHQIGAAITVCAHSIFLSMLWHEEPRVGEAWAAKATQVEQAIGDMVARHTSIGHQISSAN